MNQKEDKYRYTDYDCYGQPVFRHRRAPAKREGPGPLRLTLGLPEGLP